MAANSTSSEILKHIDILNKKLPAGWAWRGDDLLSLIKSPAEMPKPTSSDPNSVLNPPVSIIDTGSKHNALLSPLVVEQTAKLFNIDSYTTVLTSGYCGRTDYFHPEPLTAKGLSPSDLEQLRKEPSELIRIILTFPAKNPKHDREFTPTPGELNISFWFSDPKNTNLSDNKFVPWLVGRRGPFFDKISQVTPSTRTKFPFQLENHVTLEGLYNNSQMITLDVGLLSAEKFSEVLKIFLDEKYLTPESATYLLNLCVFLSPFTPLQKSDHASLALRSYNYQDNIFTLKPNDSNSSADTNSAADTKRSVESGSNENQSNPKQMTYSEFLSIGNQWLFGASCTNSTTSYFENKKVRECIRQEFLSYEKTLNKSLFNWNITDFEQAHLQMYPKLMNQFKGSRLITPPEYLETYMAFMICNHSPILPSHLYNYYLGAKPEFVWPLYFNSTFVQMRIKMGQQKEIDLEKDRWLKDLELIAMLATRAYFRMYNDAFQKGVRTSILLEKAAKVDLEHTGGTEDYEKFLLNAEAAKIQEELAKMGSKIPHVSFTPLADTQLPISSNQMASSNSSPNSSSHSSVLSSSTISSVVPNKDQTRHDDADKGDRKNNEGNKDKDKPSKN